MIYRPETPGSHVTVLTPVVPQEIMKSDLSYEIQRVSLRPMICDGMTVKCSKSMVFQLIINPFAHSLRISSNYWCYRSL